MPKVSVIMAVYNTENQDILEKAVDSVLMQTYADLEFVICDDASTDNTRDLLKRITKKDRRVKLIFNKTNRKAGYARNNCIRNAKGNYIAVMDADDISEITRIEKLANFLDRHPEYDFVGGRGEFFINHIGDDSELYWYCQKPQPKDFLFSLPFVHASLMFRKEALEKVHGYETAKKIIRVEDYDLLLRLYGEGMRGYNINEVLYYIRRDNNQYKRRKYRFRFNEAFIKYRGFKKMGLFPKGILFALKPLIVGLIPTQLMAGIQKKYYSKKQGYER